MLATLGIACVLGSVVCGAAASQDDTTKARVVQLESICREATARTELPSVAVLVTLGGETLLAREFERHGDAPDGHEHLDARREAGALFEPLVAFAAARLIASDELTLDARVATLLPPFAETKSPVTLAQLLTHTSGLATYRDYLRSRSEVSADALLTWIAQQPLTAEPGTCFEYSESNVFVLASVVARIGGGELSSVIDTRVLAPAKLPHAGWAPRTQRLKGESLEISGEWTDVEPAWPLLGLGAPVATLEELTSLAGFGWNGQLLGAPELEHLTKPPALADRSEIPMAWGWSRSRIDRRLVLALGGRTQRSVIHLAVVPEVELVIALASRTSEISLAALGRRLARAALQEPEPGALDVQLTPEDCERYVGGYYIGCTRISIEARGTTLWFVPPADDEFRLRSQGRHRFASAADADVWLEFDVPAQRAEGFVLNSRGTQTYARRVE